VKLDIEKIFQDLQNKSVVKPIKQVDKIANFEKLKDVKKINEVH